MYRKDVDDNALGFSFVVSILTISQSYHKSLVTDPVLLNHWIYLRPSKTPNPLQELFDLVIVTTKRNNICKTTN